MRRGGEIRSNEAFQTDETRGECLKIFSLSACMPCHGGFKKLPKREDNYSLCIKDICIKNVIPNSVLPILFVCNDIIRFPYYYFHIIRFPISNFLFLAFQVSWLSSDMGVGFPVSHM